MCFFILKIKPSRCFIFFLLLLRKILEKYLQILLFNCMSVRDPQLLLPNLMKTCASHGEHQEALFDAISSIFVEKYYHPVNFKDLK